MESLFDDDDTFDQKLLEEALKSEEVLKALGPLNEDWFKNLNERFVQEMIQDTFAIPSTQISIDDEHVQDLKLLKAVTDLESAGTCSSNITLKPSVRKSNVEEDLSKAAFQNDSFSDSDFPELPAETLMSVQVSVSDRNKVVSENQEPPQLRSSSRLNPVVVEKRLETESPHHSASVSVCKNPTTNDFVGFTTASNKPLSFSSNSLQKAKLLLKDVHTSNGVETTENCSSNCEPSTVQFTSASKKPLSVSSKALEKASNFLAKVHDASTADSQLTKSQLNPGFKHSNISHEVGFMTASKRPLTISAAAWRKGQKLISSLTDNEQLISPNVANKSDVDRVKVQTKSDRRCSFGGFPTVSSPLFKPVKAKRRNSLYKPPRKRTPLQDLPSLATNGSLAPCNKADRSNHLLISRRHLGLKQDQESQICVSDESMLKAMALFEKV